MSTFRRNIPSLSALVTLESAARHMSFTEAAKELNVKQPAVSRQVRTSSGSLGSPLFVRRHRALDLTPKGQQMATVLTQSIEHIVGTWQEIQGAMARKRLHVSAYDAFSTLWLAPRLPLFRAENPELSIFVDTQDHDPDLRRNDFDLALRFGDGHWSDGEAIFLFRDEIVPVCSPGYLRELPPMTTPDSMKAHSIIDYSRGGRAWQGWEDWTQFAFGRPIEARTDTYYSYYMDAVTAAVEGQGVVLGWKAIVEKYLDTGALVAISPAVMTSASAHYIVTTQNRRNMDAVERFKAWIVEVCRRYQR